MFIVLTYDIGVKRVAKVMKICRKYLVHVQKSVFEGNITETKLKKLKSELRKIIHSEDDSICIYEVEKLMNVQKEQIGVVHDNSYII